MPTVKDAWNDYVKSIEKANSLISSAPPPNSPLAAELKKLLSGISNLATRILSMDFIDWLKKVDMLADNKAKEAKEEIDATSANSNGYDIVLPKGIVAEIVAEVKCMIPLNDKGYGPQQQNGIIKDLKGLLGFSKEKSLVQLNNANIQWENCIKFMVLLNENNAIDAFKKIQFLRDGIDSRRFNIVNSTGKIYTCPYIVNVVFLPCGKNIIAVCEDGGLEKQGEE